MPIYMIPVHSRVTHQMPALHLFCIRLIESVVFTTRSCIQINDLTAFVFFSLYDRLIEFWLNSILLLNRPQELTRDNKCFLQEPCSLLSRKYHLHSIFKEALHGTQFCYIFLSSTLIELFATIGSPYLKT